MISYSRSSASVACKILAISALISLLFVAGCTSSGNSESQVGPPAKLAFTMQPSSAAAGGSITPAVTVSIEDSAGHVVTTATSQVTIALGTNPSSGTLSGTLAATAVAGVATFSNLSINNAGTGYTLAASATGLSGATSSAFSVFGPAAKLAFTVQPSNVMAGNAITPAVTVSIEDATGNVVTTATSQITIAIGTNPSSGTLTGTVQANAVAGMATFSTLSINKPGTGYTLTSSASGLTGDTSSAFNVTPGAPAKLVFTVQPSNVVAGNSIAVAVTVEDALGNVVTSATNSITMAIGTNPSSGTLSGSTTVTASGGVATFSNLSINKVGTGYTLAASATGLTAATSSAFNVTVGAANKLGFTVQPSNVAAGSPIAVAVSVEDALGNVVTTATDSVSVAIGTNPSSGTLSGTTPVTASAGVAAFANLSINKVGTGYTLTASASGLTGATSSAFNVVAGAATKVVFTVQPSNVTAGSSITPTVAVSVEDAAGNLVTAATNQVTIAIGTNPSSGTLSGTAQVNAVAGVATFSTLTINKVGTGYTLTASASGLTGATSSAFNVTVGTAAKLVFTVQPGNVTAGSPNPVAVSIEDSQGNLVTTATNSVSVAIGANPSSGTLSGTTPVAAAAGVATFSDLNINKAGTGYTLTASASGLSGTTSNAFNVTAGNASKLVFTQQPNNVVAGISIAPAVTVSIEDTLGNVVLTATNSVSVAIGTNPSSGTLSGTTPVTATAGVATFSDLKINNVGNGYTLTASATGLAGATSSAFNVIVSVGPPAKLAFTVEPSNVAAGSSITPAVQVSVEDAAGNLVSSATNSITMSIGINPLGGTLSGTLTVAAVSGVATFSNLSINIAANGYSLQADATSLTGASSTVFNVTPGNATQLQFTTQPGGGTTNTPWTQQPVVTVKDAEGNTVTSSSASITVAIVSGTGTSGATLTCTSNTLSATSGVAMFAGCQINLAGSGYKLMASATSLTSVTSTVFNVTGVASQLVFTVEPSNVAPNATITPAVQVSIEDNQGNVITSATNNITLAIKNNPNFGTLGGTLTQAAVSGVATFSDLSIDNGGNGYTLQATAAPLTSAISSSFNVTTSLQASCAGAPSGYEHLMTGPWAFLVQGWTGSGSGSPFAGIFSLNANGTDNGGALTAAGQFDRQNGAAGANSYATFSIDQNNASGTSSYVIGPDSTGSGYVGCMTLAITNTGTSGTALVHYRFSLGGLTGAAGTSTTRATKMTVIRWDDTTGTGNRSSGVGLPQDSSEFNLSFLQSDYAFGLDGVDVNGGHFAEAGSEHETSSGNYNLEFDVDDAGNAGTSTGPFVGTVTVFGISATTGFGTVTSTVQGVQSTGNVLIVNKNEGFFLSGSPYTNLAGGGPILSGRLIVTGSQGTHSALSGNFMIHLSGINTVAGNGGCNVNSTQVNCADVNLVVVSATKTGAQTASIAGYSWEYSLGRTVAPNTIGGVTATTDATWGRISLAGAGVNQAPVFYLAAPVTSGSDQTEPFLGFGAGSGTAGNVDTTGLFGFVETGASSNVSTSSLAGNYFAGAEDPGDNRVGVEVDVVTAASSGSLTGSGFKSGSNGLGTQNITGAAITVTNSDPTGVAADTFPGLMDLGNGTLGITNGTRLIFFDTGSNFGTAGTNEARFIIVDKQ
jgi:hypothetical protein